MRPRVGEVWRLKTDPSAREEITATRTTDRGDEVQTKTAAAFVLGPSISPFWRLESRFVELWEREP